MTKRITALFFALTCLLAAAGCEESTTESSNETILPTETVSLETYAPETSVPDTEATLATETPAQTRAITEELITTLPCQWLAKQAAERSQDADQFIENYSALMEGYDAWFEEECEYYLKRLSLNQDETGTPTVYLTTEGTQLRATVCPLLHVIQENPDLFPTHVPTLFSLIYPSYIDNGYMEILSDNAEWQFKGSSDTGHGYTADDGTIPEYLEKNLQEMFGTQEEITIAHENGTYSTCIMTDMGSILYIMEFQFLFEEDELNTIMLDLSAYPIHDNAYFDEYFTKWCANTHGYSLGNDLHGDLTMPDALLGRSIYEEFFPYLHGMLLPEGGAAGFDGHVFYAVELGAKMNYLVAGRYELCWSVT